MQLPRLRVDPVDHRLHGAERCDSPNHDERPDRDDISLLVIHAISLPPGRYGGPWVDQLFTNRLDPAADPYFETIRTVKVSAHLLILRDGRIRQYVPFDRRAWHAGESAFDGRSRCNDFSIGIELEGCDDDAFEPAQYRVLVRAAAALMEAYPAIAPSRIAGHSDIAPARKTDPGPRFDWNRFLYELEFAR